jgi:hypothetical protein
MDCRSPGDAPPSPAGGPHVPADIEAAPSGNPQTPELCSHAARDMHNHNASCYYLLRGLGPLGSPGGALCARGYKGRIAQCPRLWP